MKLNQNQPALVLDFTGLQNSARKALSGTVQRFLMDKLGFHWRAANFRDKAEMYLGADAIAINDSPECPLAMVLVREDSLPATRRLFKADTKFFDATCQLDEFFVAVEKTLPKTPVDMLATLIRVLADKAGKRPSGSPIREPFPHSSS